MVDDRVQLEVIKLPGGRFAPLGNALENPVALDAQVVADDQRRSVGHRQARAGAPLSVSDKVASTTAQRGINATKRVWDSRRANSALIKRHPMPW